MDNCQVEYNRIIEKLNALEQKISQYPKGSLRRRTIRGRDYHYLQFRDGKHVRSRYVKECNVEDLRIQIETRKELETEAEELQKRLKKYARLIGVHRSYRPVKDIDYESYALFMSTVAHDHKSLGTDQFLEKYDLSKYRGLNKRYLAGYLDYISGIDRQNVRKTNDLVLDPYTYLMYFKYGQKEVLEEELHKAIPAFLSRGLLITRVQEAVDGPFS